MLQKTTKMCTAHVHTLEAALDKLCRGARGITQSAEAGGSDSENQVAAGGSYLRSSLVWVECEAKEIL